LDVDNNIFYDSVIVMHICVYLWKIELFTFMNITKIKHLIHLIEKERTGTPQESAHKIGTSERSIYLYVKCIKKELKAPVRYSRFRKTYYFSEPGNLTWEWKKKR
jgi:hypothetical protein